MNFVPFVAQEIVIYGAEESGISAVVTAIFMFALIGILLLKIMNVIKLGELYEVMYAIAGFVVGLISFFMVLIGLLINQTVTFAVYLYFSIALISVITFFFVIEMILNLANYFSRPRLNENFNPKKRMR